MNYDDWKSGTDDERGYGHESECEACFRKEDDLHRIEKDFQRALEYLYGRIPMDKEKLEECLFDMSCNMKLKFEFKSDDELRI